jgi:VanZ family protein
MSIPIPLLPRWLRYAGAGGVAAVLLYFSVLTTPPVSPPEPDPLWDKKLHFAGYAALTLALAYATVQIRPRRRRVAAAVGVAIAYGLVIEALQLPQPTRYVSVADALANAIGAALASVWFLVEPRLRYVAVGGTDAPNES